MKPDVAKLNKALTDVILDKCRGKKKILLTLTGGMDTRVILSILLKHGIKFDTLTHTSERDNHEIPIVNKIVKTYGLSQLITHTGDWTKPVYKEISKHYDLILFGFLMTEDMSVLEFYNKSEMGVAVMRDTFVEEIRYRHPTNWFSPMDNVMVVSALMDIPMMFRGFSIIQRALVEENIPELIKFGYTNYNLKRALMGMIYKWTMKLL